MLSVWLHQFVIFASLQGTHIVLSVDNCDNGGLVGLSLRPGLLRDGVQGVGLLEGVGLAAVSQLSLIRRIFFVTNRRGGWVLWESFDDSISRGSEGPVLLALLTIAPAAFDALSDRALGHGVGCAIVREGCHWLYTSVE